MGVLIKLTGPLTILCQTAAKISMVSWYVNGFEILETITFHINGIEVFKLGFTGVTLSESQIFYQFFMRQCEHPVCCIVSKFRLCHGLQFEKLSK